ncbi:hypothetical protein K431DRAFT_294196 [Polychaeton citri CBS 116435]|uniref:Uncharacterized protein n=1 Tax=Polychaeton citri CBS 116435 TaxID=1314669 RepID=A0A9P4UPB6_9PEZI|nr:hypothetical protein K431DRAFT_294196 [Polychaeton citri CBS 116435]
MSMERVPAEPKDVFFPTSSTVSSPHILKSPSDNERPLPNAVEHTVMAEQVSHNVVGNSESTGGFAPLVDAHANDSTTTIAGNGNKSSNHAKISYPEPANDTNSENTLSAESTTLASSSTNAYSRVGFGDGSGLTNGVQKVAAQESSVDGRTTPDISGNVSVSSDTDRSGLDGGEIGRDGVLNRPARANSIKKPTTFSKVSVTKNFMAKTAAGGAPSTVVQPSSKGESLSTLALPGGRLTTSLASPISAASTPITKPRLIAKTGSSLISKPKATADSASGPDGSKVWNKNQPPQPAPAKQFTDEELKQQYGIHMASRLQADDNSKESKWADIDDDEDDWAPETVTWMDGTKSTIAPADTASAPNDPKSDQKQNTQQQTNDKDRPTPAQAKQPSETTTTRTILKPGAGTHAKQIGALSPSPGADKQSQVLKTKSTVVPPVRSPWAKLPSVDAVPIINPPLQQPERPVLPPQDARVFDQPSTRQFPAREMAPDAFDRYSRDTDTGSRELFNSANGRYEPAPDVRRGSGRWSRQPQPSVLQRPSPSVAPADEQSPDYQARSQGDAGPWESRRRGSSVSHGSASIRRVSIARSNDLPPDHAERRQSTIIGHDMRGAPHDKLDGGAPRFTQQTAWDQQMPAQPPVDQSPADQPPQEDPVEVQQRIMKEKREEARKRRLEEEAREEVAKQERLRAKLAALEGAGKSKKEREAEALAKANDIPAESLSEATATQSSVKSTQLTEVEENTSAPTKQATVLEHSAETPSPQANRLDEQSPAPLQASEATPRSLSSNETFERQPQNPTVSPKVGSRALLNQQASPNRQILSTYSSPGERKPQPFSRATFGNSDATTAWPTMGPNTNVWGSSGIGNGTFGGNNAFAPLQSNTLPPPPGMAQPSGSAKISPQGFGQEPRSPSLSQQATSEQPAQLPPPGITRPDMWTGHPRASGPSPSAGMGRQAHPPGPIAPPSRAQQQQSQPPYLRHDRASAWQQASNRLPDEFREGAAAAEQSRKEMAVQAKPKEKFPGVIEETFKKTTSSGQLGSRAYTRSELPVHDVQSSKTLGEQSPVPPASQTRPMAPLPSTSPINAFRLPHEQPGRVPGENLASRALAAAQPPIGPPTTQPPRTLTPAGSINFRAGPLPQISPYQDIAPPPPETKAHPVNDGAPQHPRVRLPFSKPVVKLPPPPIAQAMHTQQPSSAMVSPVRSWGPPGARPIAMDPQWQARFNGLFNRTPIQTETPPSPPKTPPKLQGLALAVASSSRGFLDVDSASISGKTTVSLPVAKRDTTREGFTIDDSNEIVSRPIVEAMFLEEQSFGSRPVIKFPRNAVYESIAYGARSVQHKPTLGTEELPRWPEVQIIPELPVKYLLPKSPQGYFVKLPGVNMRNKLVRHSRAQPPRQNGVDDRRPSGRFNKGKGAAGDRSSPATANTPTSGKSDAGNGNVTPQRTASAAIEKSDGQETNPPKTRREARGGKVNRGAHRTRA